MADRRKPRCQAQALNEVRREKARTTVQMQFNVVDAETLKDAQKHPEKYKHLLIRVAAYSAFFVNLTKEVQDDIIGRTQLSWA